MKALWSCTALAALCLAVPAEAGEAAPTAPRSFQVPYRLTVPKHLLVRAKINGKGPFNFILDTGAPALFVAEPVCKKLGIAEDGNGWATFDRFEIEGGVVLNKVRGRVETPFQLEGMNGMGLAGAELHGIIGYNLLARYRVEIDFTRDKMVWTPLNFTPKAPFGLGRKGVNGSLNMVGTLLKAFGWLLGKQTAPQTAPRGFLGMQLADGNENPVIRAVLPGGPAAKAGVRAGDVLTHFQGRRVIDADDVHRFARKLTAGKTVKLTVLRGKDSKEITFTTGEGL